MFFLARTSRSARGRRARRRLVGLGAAHRRDYQAVARAAPTVLPARRIGVDQRVCERVEFVLARCGLGGGGGKRPVVDPSAAPTEPAEAHAAARTGTTSPAACARFISLSATDTPKARIAAAAAFVRPWSRGNVAWAISSVREGNGSFFPGRAMSDDYTPTTRQRSRPPAPSSTRSAPTRVIGALRRAARTSASTNEWRSWPRIAELHATHIDDPMRSAALQRRAGAARCAWARRRGGRGRPARGPDPRSAQRAGRHTAWFEHLIVLGRFAERPRCSRPNRQSRLDAARGAMTGDDSAPATTRRTAGGRRSAAGDLCTRRAQRHRQVAALCDGRSAVWTGALTLAEGVQLDRAHRGAGGRAPSTRRSAEHRWGPSCTGGAGDPSDGGARRTPRPARAPARPPPAPPRRSRSRRSCPPERATTEDRTRRRRARPWPRSTPRREPSWPTDRPRTGGPAPCSSTSARSACSRGTPTGRSCSCAARSASTRSRARPSRRSSARCRPPEAGTSWTACTARPFPRPRTTTSAARCCASGPTWPSTAWTSAELHVARASGRARAACNEHCDRLRELYTEARTGSSCRLLETQSIPGSCAAPDPTETGAWPRVPRAWCASCRPGPLTRERLATVTAPPSSLHRALTSIHAR